MNCVVVLVCFEKLCDSSLNSSITLWYAVQIGESLYPGKRMRGWLLPTVKNRLVNKVTVLGGLSVSFDAA